MKAQEYLKGAADILDERAKQYDSPEGERSMAQTVAAFNAITGKDLKESDGWLIMRVLKSVRTRRPGEFHADSVLDGVGYSSLEAEALYKEAHRILITGEDLIEQWASAKSGMQAIIDGQDEYDLIQKGRAENEALMEHGMWVLGRPGLDRPKIVCLCGSTRFWKTYQAESLRLALEGAIVLSVGAATSSDFTHFAHLPLEEAEEIKRKLDELHLRKIDLCDELFVINIGGYIGAGTSAEIGYARNLGKPISTLRTVRLYCKDCGTPAGKDRTWVFDEEDSQWVHNCRHAGYGVEPQVITENIRLANARNGSVVSQNVRAVGGVPGIGVVTEGPEVGQYRRLPMTDDPELGRTLCQYDNCTTWLFANEQKSLDGKVYCSPHYTEVQRTWLRPAQARVRTKDISVGNDE